MSSQNKKKKEEEEEEENWNISSHILGLDIIETYFNNINLRVWTAFSYVWIETSGGF